MSHIEAMIPAFKTLWLIKGVGGRVVRSLLQLSERWPYHFLYVGRMKFASLEANLGGDRGLLVYSILLVSPFLG